MIKLLKSPDRIFYTVSYIIFSLPLIIFLVFKFPAFQVPDEVRHFARAYQVTDGDFFSTKQPNPNKPGQYIVGGLVDPGIYAADAYYSHMQHKREVTIDRVKTDRADKIKWTSGRYYHTPAVSIYPSIHYLIPALGIMLGETLDLGIVSTLKLSRLMNAMFTLLVIGIALFYLKKGHGVIFILLLMPMTISQIASTSQDATCFAAAALCVAMLSQLDFDLPKNKRRMLLLASSLLLVVIGVAKPPWIGMSLFFLYYAFKFRTEKSYLLECSFAFLGSFFAVLVWVLYLAKFVSVPFGVDGIDYREQVLFILQSPFEWLKIFVNSWQQRGFYWSTIFMANLGHLDTPFPYPYYGLTALTLLFSLAWGYLAEKKACLTSMLKNLLGPLIIILVTVVGLGAVIYIMWTPLHHPRLEGIHGRYLIPVALFIALGASIKPLRPRSEIIYRSMLLIFALSTLIVTPYVVLNRFY